MVKKFKPEEDQDRPAIFDPSNERIWSVARRVMIFILRELKKHYNFPTVKI
jgi:hypothetical protein